MLSLALTGRETKIHEVRLSKEERFKIIKADIVVVDMWCPKNYLIR